MKRNILAADEMYTRVLERVDLNEKQIKQKCLEKEKKMQSVVDQIKEHTLKNLDIV